MKSTADNHEYLYKVILLGEINVGKTYILSRYLSKSAPSLAKATVGVEFSLKNIKLKSGKRINVHLWDTAGQERYHSIVRAHCRNAIGAILVFDLTSRPSFLRIENCLHDLKTNADPEISIMLLGNKADLIQSEPYLRQVSQEEAKSYARKNGMLYEETSAVTGLGIRSAFKNLYELIYEKTKNRREVREMRSKLIPGIKQKVRCC
jgi:Rab family protein